MARSVDGRRGELATRLRAVRASTFRSGQRFAEHLGWPQSRVSKLETGAQMPTDEDIDAWVVGAAAPPEVRAELVALLSAARVEYISDREFGRRGGWAKNQASLVQAEAESSRLVSWQPGMIPGLLQTAAYTREMLAGLDALGVAGLSSPEVDGVVAERMRRQEILYAPDKRIELYLGEGALVAAPGRIDTLLGQLDRLATLAGLSTVRVGVIPFPAMPVLPLHGFALRDDLVILESLTGEQRISDPGEVAVYLRALDALREAALFGDDAVALINRTIRSLAAESPTSHK